MRLCIKESDLCLEDSRIESRSQLQIGLSLMWSLVYSIRDSHDGERS
jgi:hypothetical protein